VSATRHTTYVREERRQEVEATMIEVLDDDDSWPAQFTACESATEPAESGP